MRKFRNPMFIAIILAITLAFVFSLSSHSQNVVKRGNVFVNVDSTARQEAKKTDYSYQKGDSIWPVYLSSKGKAFIVRYSKRTKKAYRQYLPQITEQLNSKRNGNTSK